MHRNNKNDYRRTVSMPALNCYYNGDNKEDGIKGDNLEVNFYQLRHVSSLENISVEHRKMMKCQELQKIRDKLTMAERMEKTSPYNMFFNCLENVPKTYSQLNAIQFRGKVKSFLTKLIILYS